MFDHTRRHEITGTLVTIVSNPSCAKRFHRVHLWTLHPPESFPGSTARRKYAYKPSMQESKLGNKQNSMLSGVIALLLAASQPSVGF